MLNSFLINNVKKQFSKVLSHDLKLAVFWPCWINAQKTGCCSSICQGSHNCLKTAFQWYHKCGTNLFHPISLTGKMLSYVVSSLYITEVLAGLEIATDTVASATKVLPLVTKNSITVISLVTVFLLDSNREFNHGGACKGWLKIFINFKPWVGGDVRVFYMSRWELWVWKQGVG